jgi:hypothetical protein
MWLKWFPWRYLIKRLARAQGFVDPISLLAQFNRFSTPSEVFAPKELLRAGLVLTARGVINSQAIQHNLDWVWPYWVSQQFDPKSSSFIPRAFSMSHINLTHRNWTAVGIPGVTQLPIVDPRGLVMPYFDSWSVDFWLFQPDGTTLLPSQLREIEQRIIFNDTLEVETVARQGDAVLSWRVRLLLQCRIPVCHIEVRADTAAGSRLAVAVRPYNPEGVSFITALARRNGGRQLVINRKDKLYFDTTPASVLFSCYEMGDVYRMIQAGESSAGESVKCEVGMATAAALFEITPQGTQAVNVLIPLGEHAAGFDPLTPVTLPVGAWRQSHRDVCRLAILEQHEQFLFDNAIRTMILHTPQPSEVYAGPFIYKRYWYRDAVLISHAMLLAGITARAEAIIDAFFKRQTASGYFLSQDGEWDSNGQVLWLLGKYCTLTNSPPKAAWKKGIRKGGRWLEQKIRRHKTSTPYAGLLPAGFSAEHLGPNDHYYWDNYWAVAGLQAAAAMMEAYGEKAEAGRFKQSAERLAEAIEQSLQWVARRLGKPLLPASPVRRMDSGAVGSLVCGYPLGLYAPDDKRLANTVDFLLANTVVRDAFFHDISHSGINPYLTLHIAQTLLRAGDLRFLPLVKGIARLASSTGQWPEGIHPYLGTGCMGDGQHVWGAAEWVLIMRYMFLREEHEPRRLILCAGIPRAWLRESGQSLSIGPAPTEFGALTLQIAVEQQSLRISWQGRWHHGRPRVDVAFYWGQPIEDIKEDSVVVPFDKEEK